MEQYVPAPSEKVALTCRRFAGRIDRSWHISSFSSLVADQQHDPDQADRDPIALPYYPDKTVFAASTVEEGPLSIFSFPRGKKAGTFLHDLFEHLDFGQNAPAAIKGLIAEKLEAYGFEPTWVEVLYNMIQKVLSVPLDPSRDDFTLSQIQNTDRMNELSFYFPLKWISPKNLKTLFAEYAGSGLPTEFPSQMERLHFAPLRGFMRGFMDMVFQFEGRFYLVDWKSNFLGGRIADYGQESLAMTMQKHYYILQYTLYTLALDQYLRLRLPGYRYEKNFGGIFYIFHRGVAPDKGADFGIYRGLPSPDLIKALREGLIEIR